MKCKVFCLTLMFLLAAACAPKPSVSVEPPAGKWSGDYGPDADRRDPVALELRWEDNNLRGVVQAGRRSFPLTKASFKSDTGAIVIEFEAEGNNGQAVRYVIDGKVDGHSMAGSWSHDAQRGDFHLSKE